MPARKIQVEYDDIARLARRMDDEGADSQALMQRIRTLVSRLEGGGWLGQGAERFYDEMYDEVLPALNRLVEALQLTADTMRHVSFLLGDAEQDGANRMQLGDGGGSMVGGAPGVAKIPGPPAPFAPTPFPSVGGAASQKLGPAGEAGLKMNPGDAGYKMGPDGGAIGGGMIGGDAEQKVQGADDYKFTPGGSKLGGSKLDPDVGGSKLGDLGDSKLDPGLGP